MFWDRYELLCKQKGKSPNAFAKEIGAGTSACTYWKKGVIPKGETLEKIADCLECSVDYLLERTDNPKSHIKSSETNNQLIELLTQLTPTEQEMISLQIKGLLTAKKSPPPKGSEQD